MSDALAGLGLRIWQEDHPDEEGLDLPEASAEALLRSRAVLVYGTEGFATSRSGLLTFGRAWTLAERSGPPTARVGICLPPGTGTRHLQGSLAAARVFRAEGRWEGVAGRVKAWLDQAPPLPLGELEGPALPTWSPTRRSGSKRFVGRDNELWRVHRLLHEAGPTFLTEGRARVVLVRGMSGVGKSKTLLEYARRFEAAWPGGIFLLDAGALRIEDHLDAFASALGVPSELAPVDRAAEARQRLAERTQPYLWLVDNLSADCSLLQAEAWLAPGSAGATLMATRGSHLDRLGASIDLQPLPPEVALRLVRQDFALPVEEERQARSLVLDLRGLPIALEVLRALVDRDRAAGRTSPFAEWSSRLTRRVHERVASGDGLAPPRGQAVDAEPVSAVLQAALEDLSEEAWDVLRSLAQLAEAPVPARLMAGALRWADRAAPEQADLRAHRGCSELAGRSLIDWTDGALSIHPLVRSVVQQRDPEAARVVALGEVLSGLVNEELGEVEDPRTHPQSAAWLPHAERLLTGTWREEKARLAGTLAIRHRVAGNLAKARSLTEQAQETFGRLVGPTHTDTLRSLNNLAAIQMQLGDLQAARQMLEEAVALEDTPVQRDQTDQTVFIALRMNLAGVFGAQGELDRAATMYERAQADSVRVNGAEHADTLNIEVGLGTTLVSRGDLLGGLHYLHSAHERLSKALGRMHPSTLTALGHVGLALQRLGDLQGAKDKCEFAWQASRQTLGAKHYDTLMAQVSFAEVLGNLGDWNRARQLYEEALPALTQSLGIDHRSTLAARQNLANALKAQGELGQALLLETQTLLELNRTLGPEHPQSLKQLVDLMTTRQAIGYLLEALDLGNQALILTTRVLGPEHQTTLAARWNLAATHEALGHFQEATRLYEEAYTAMVRVQGQDTLQTLRLRFKLAEALYALGDLDAARRHLDHVLTVKLPPSGAEEPDALQAQALLATVLQEQGEWKRAEALFAQVLAARLRVNGLGHPSTLKAAISWASCGLYREQRLPDPRLLETLAHALKQAEPARPLGTTDSLFSAAIGPSSNDASQPAGQLATVLDRLHQQVTANAPQAFRARLAYATWLYQSGGLAASRRELEVLIPAISANLPDHHPLNAAARELMADVLAEDGDLVRAIEEAKLALRLRQLSTPNHPVVHRTVARVQGWVAQVQPPPPLAEAKAAAEKLHELLKAGHRWILDADEAVATLQAQQGELQEAANRLEAVVTRRAQRDGPGHPATRSSALSLRRVLVAANREQPAWLSTLLPSQWMSGLSSVELINIGLFEKAHLDFRDAGPGWHVLLGDNGSGKTTVLRAIAAALIGPDRFDYLRRDDPSLWLRSGTSTGRIELQVRLSAGEGEPEATERLVVTFQKGAVGARSPSGDRQSWAQPNRAFSLSLGSQRQLPARSQSLPQTWDHAAAHQSAFEPMLAGDAQEWLRKLAETEDGVLEDIRRFANTSALLPHGVLLDQVDRDQILFRDGAGVSVPVEQLSDGYRSVFHLVLELLRQAYLFSGGRLPFDDAGRLDVPGVVLIDEVDAHLHPSWQGTIGAWFTDRFPRIQFLVTTHSALVCRSIGANGRVFRLRAPDAEGSAQVVPVLGEDRDKLWYGTLRKALESSAFDLQLGAGPWRDHMQELQALRQKRRTTGLTSQEQDRHDRLASVLSDSLGT